MYKIQLDDRLEKVLKKLFRKNRKLYEITMKKIEKIVELPYHYKPLSYDLKGIRRIHVESSFVLVFRIDENNKIVKFLDLDHHDKIYKKRFL